MEGASIDVAVGAERLALADLVAHLDDAQWATPSLCGAWTVRDVVAHLTGTTRDGLGTILVAAVRARGSFDRMEVDRAARRATRHSTEELVQMLRESAASSRRTPGSSRMDPLMDLVIHAQDIARPLGLVHTSPPEVVAASLAYVATNRFMGAPRRLRGLRIVSTDTGWSYGHGAAVRGADVDLLLAISGRPAGLVALSGPGLARLTAQL
ncbi:maleylpyruvate isomerase family mycothiol-dependent enzyme [Nocardioides sp. cx-169]|uniref:maleylpyruvate isomerase family mycothiol-dependent enzyme n=1 Tax=Nocardioides sp. cx-169 TaxID=2899080 RepID=UPI001E34AF48|nr:maleylpyruvate isomerase family mycothiol-dependent enzyme [Nocardioides sp. cx-169]MCD4534208.1 maleylpyruvate isomerase family mycothiol-dependent enzyme [Nocardioides sp. cx-169]